MKVLKTGTVYPREHSQFIKQCSQHDQSRPTPLQLKYSTGDYNTLHQDLYGEVYFPMQAIVSLSKRSEDYSGGELVLTEQIPRAQSKAMVRDSGSRRYYNYYYAIQTPERIEGSFPD